MVVDAPKTRDLEMVFFYGISRCLFMGIEWEFHGYLMCVGEKNLEIMWNDIDISTNTIGII